MTEPACLADEYEWLYREFDSDFMRQVRAEAYGEDIGQHSWSSADELREDARLLRIGALYEEARPWSSLRPNIAGVP